MINKEFMLNNKFKNFSYLVFVLVLFLTQAAWSYPYLLDFKNSPQVLTFDKTTFVLKKMNQLTVPAFVVTSKFDEINWALPEDYQIRQSVNTKIEFPDVYEKDNAPHSVNLISGEIRLKSDNAKKLSPEHILKTAFFELPMPQNSDVIVLVNMREPSVTIQMIKGEWQLSFFAFEKKVTLQQGQQVKFSGVLNEDQATLKFDYLLDGKKIPKGSLGAIEKFDVKKFIDAEKQAEIEIEKKHKALMKKKADEIKKRKDYENSFLCKKPLAQVNQCAWYKENKKCYRKRCNVSGQWGDVTERPMGSQCTEEYLVGPCDY